MPQRHSYKCQIAVLLLLVGSTSGCRWLYREHCCPTDLRHTYTICENEAVRRCPCGPDEVDFGVKQTTWRCGPGYHPPSPCPCLNGCESCEMGTPMLIVPQETLPAPRLLPSESKPSGEAIHLNPMNYDGPGSRPNPFR